MPLQDDNGLGSLADELGDVWAEDAAEEQGSSFLDGLREGRTEPLSRSQGPDTSINTADMHDFGIGGDIAVQSSPLQRRRSRKASEPGLLSPQPNGHSRTKRKSHQHTDSSAYDGSDYGSMSDDESSSLPPSLLRRISDIESLTRMSMHSDDTLSEAGGIIPRTTLALRDLGAQSSIENSATRLMTAYTSMSTHRTHKTRDLLSATHGLPFSSLSEPEFDDLLTHIDALIACTTIPASRQNPILSLQILISDTTALMHALRALADSLQECKVAAGAAGRKLKSVREMVDEMVAEEELREESIRIIQMGDWDRRLAGRQVGRHCRDVVSGFERVCEGWRERLLQGQVAA